jgi:thiamine-monophosphate kinase
MARERTLIERVGRKVPSRAGGELRVGIGDDAAVLRLRGANDWVVTTDAFLEGVHFLTAHPPRMVGYKALARATSDIAAMGALPRYFFLDLAIPSSRAGHWLDEFLRGMAQAAVRFGLVLAGGDTTRYPRVALNLTVLGEITAGRAVLRSGARPGDLIAVSGRLGEAEFGLRLFRRGLHKRKEVRKLLRRHLQPEPRLALGQWVAKTGAASAMIDISDGLSTDLAHLCEASGVGARIRGEKIPVVRIPAGLQRLGIDPLRLALDGGDDYELLFTVPRRQAPRLPKRFRGVPLTIIGEVIREKTLSLLDARGRTKPLRPHGWDPFRKRS